MSPREKQELSDLESSTEAANYVITASGKADGSVEVTLTHKVRKHKWTGIGARHSSFPYFAALRAAYGRMMQYENRFN